MSIKTIILAAGQGARMKSDLPKVLHKIGGKPLLLHVVELARMIEGNGIAVVYGHGGDKVRSELKAIDVDWVEQAQQLGTGHAVMQVAPKLSDSDIVLILYGDVPLLEKSTLDQLLSHAQSAKLVLLTVTLDNPYGYGRIIRDSNGKVLKIVEEKDANDHQKMISEVNTGIMVAHGKSLKSWLLKLKNDNVQKEYYLTDIIKIAVSEGAEISTIEAKSFDEVQGVNDKQQLAHLERVYQFKNAIDLMERGVTIRDPSRFDIRGEMVAIGQDVEIDINVVFEGNISIGDRVKIGPNCTVKDTVIADGVEILANSVIDNAVIGADSRIGPFARLRPDTKLANNVHVGNFVEIKKSDVAELSKINHLSYIGDSTVGSGVNIGAGTITCNYDGSNKWKTIIEDGAFIGSDTQLVAPVKISKNSTVGAGSTITKDTPEDALTLSRSKQYSVPGWQRPKKKDH